MWFCKKYAIKNVMGLAFVLTFVAVNSTCLGPGHQPQMPKSAAKFKIGY